MLSAERVTAVFVELADDLSVRTDVAHQVVVSKDVEDYRMQIQATLNHLTLTMTEQAEQKTIAVATYDRANQRVVHCDALLESALTDLILLDKMDLLWSGGKAKLSVADKRVQLVLEAMVTTLSSDAVKEETCLKAQALEHTVQITITLEAIEICAFHTADGDLFAAIRYSKRLRSIVYHMRLNILEGSLRDLILLDKMDLI
ncbi:hypothetical protein MKZ07_05290 [Paenibacillus sp. FSL P4-0338]|uniref:hypothetical protein n=1 Tax=Paenibacillus sp. FSL P4-0338 TaxID=2921635 RepID=UPI0030F891B5